MDRALLESLNREHLIEIVMAQSQTIEQLTKRVEELEARLGGPPKTPGNSSIPPSLGRKPSDEASPKPKGGRIAVKVINHLGDEVMKVFRV